MKRVLLIIVCMVTLLPLMAQVGEPRRDLTVGLNGGYVLNKIDFNPSIRQKMHGGATIGGMVRYTCEKYFSLICGVQAELNFAQMGWKEDIRTSSDTYERTMNYFQLPVLCYLGLGKELGGARGYLVIGPQIGLCLGESEKRTGEWSKETLALRPNNVTQQYDLAVQKIFEYGITGGLGCEVSTKKGLRFQLEGRYFFSLSDIFNNSKKDPFGRSANGAIIARGAVLFDLIKTKK